VSAPCWHRLVSRAPCAVRACPRHDVLPVSQRRGCLAATRPDSDRLVPANGRRHLGAVLPTLQQDASDPPTATGLQHLAFSTQHHPRSPAGSVLADIPSASNGGAVWTVYLHIARASAGILGCLTSRTSPALRSDESAYRQPRSGPPPRTRAEDPPRAHHFRAA
jgi:hypothetical protein